ncbi:hypothetical protein [Candidatus Nitrosotenuis cloacae]|uniref:capsular polysaccharide export protein, LipB/KpsS family n=1 Tax=Candidatus Nitrosotenuis cloacae TaxID=1603555 RepID=UPI00227FCF53|nr:hypothetical protein [Candidatus Nitrosotenuis cloacae]
MTDRILFWLDASLLNYCLSYYLEKKYPADYFAIVDITTRPKIFFQNQKLVDFKKVWFYYDHVGKKQEINIDYLRDFEKKYGINLWKFAINERLFYKYNQFHNFTKNEILSILEQECKLFESIIQEVKPNYLITPDSGLHHGNLFSEICRKHNTRVIMINISKFGGGSYLSEKIHTIDNLHTLDNIQSKGRDLTTLQTSLKESSLSTSLNNYTKETRSSKLALCKAAFQLLFISNNQNIKTHYSYYGRTKLRVLANEISTRIKTKLRNRYLNKHSIYKIEDEKFIYLPLHQEPERSLLLDAPFYTNQIETIRNVSKAIPIEYTLYVKEHPTQGKARGWRPISEYKEIMAIPNVKMIHHSIPSDELIQKSSLVISVGGTASFEAAFYEKPSIMFADLGYAILPSIFKIKSFDDLTQTILKALDTKINPIDLDKYLSVLEENTFDFDWIGFVLKCHKQFYYDGNLVDVEIDPSKMEKFLNDEKPILEKLADQYIKKFQIK